MAALDPSTADRVLTIPATPFTSLPWGDINLQTFDLSVTEPPLPPGPPITPVTTALGNLGLRDLTFPMTALLSMDMFAPPDNWTVIIAAEGLTGVGAEVRLRSDAGNGLLTVLELRQWGEISAAANGANLPGFHEYTPGALNVVALTGNLTESFLTASGEGVIATGPGGSSAPYASPGSQLTTQGAGTVVGLWMWEGVALSQTDVVDTVNAIHALLSGGDPDPDPDPEPTPRTFEAEGRLNVHGSMAGFTTADLYEDPEPEIPVPGGSVTPPEPPLPPLPPDYAPEPLRHVWQRLEAPVLDSDGLDRNWMPTHEGNAEYARFQIVVEGVDITYYLGAATPEPDWSETEPFGWGPATIRLPQLTVFHQMPSWAKNGANVMVRMSPVAGSSLSSTVTLYEGVVTRVGDRQEGGVVTLECTGLLYVADLQLRKPSFNTTPLDIGTAIPKALNAVVSRRYWQMARTTTGIRTSVAGGNEPLLTGWLANILATAVDGKKQWTVALESRRPVLRVKNTTSTDWIVRAGQPGVSVDLGSDAAEGVNCIYGSGVNPDGGRWRNAKYPNWRPDDTPPFPNWSPVRSIRVGHRDSDTDSGSGVSDYQRKAGMPVTGVFSAANAAETKRQQRRMNIFDDGIPGPQTWAATFATGSNTGSLDGAFQAPLAVATEVEPRLYGPDGDDLGPNPDYDPDVIRVEREVSYGQGVTRTEGAHNARAVLARDSDPGLAGTITFDRVDPEQMHRYQLRAGSNGVVRGHRGQDVRLHVAGMSKRGQSVTLTVDTKARDYPTLQAVLERDRQATDPARTARLRLLQGQVTTDRPEYDAESPAGRIPRHAVHGGLWNVLRIPMGDHGRVVRTEFRTSGPAQRFSFAVFGKAVTPNQLASRIGNPLTASENPWDKDLDSLALLQSYGWNKQPAGYWPGQYSNPDGESASPVTGRLVDDTSWDFASAQSPWLWVAVIAANPGLIEGRLFGAAA